MQAALGLAQRGLGTVWPNPSVGCVLVADGRVVGRGWTQPGGRPHAEVEALAMAGDAAAGATAYVTLEPCAHHGKTPPCAEALIAAGIRRVVVAMVDPDPRVSGQGLERLRQAGMVVECGLFAKEAADLNSGFLKRINHGLPHVTLKLATTLDGKIATHSGESRWITGDQARAMTHLLRAEHDLVMVGIGTALADNPDLTCRLPGLEDRSPIRAVVDGRLRLPLAGHLATSSGDSPVWVLAQEETDSLRADALVEQGIDVIPVTSGEDGRIDLEQGLRKLAERGITRVLVEGGGRLSAALLRAGLIDQLVWMHAPRLIGGDGVPAVVGFGIDHLSQTPRFSLQQTCRMGEDTVSFFKRIEA